MLSTPRSRISGALAVVFVSFVVLGLPDGVFGTLWPTQRSDMNLAVGDLSWIIVGYTIGYAGGSVASGHITARWSTSAGMRVALVASFFGLIGFGLAPDLRSLVLVAIVVGGGAGLLDPIVNAWVALRHSARAMGFLHAFFGLGAAIGPPFATSALSGGITWRGVFVILGFTQLGILAIVWAKRGDFDSGDLHETHADKTDTNHVESRLLVLTLVWFFLVVGLEVSASSWAFSLLFEDRGVAEGTAALWMASFWGTFTLVRVLLGIVGDHLPQEGALWASIGVTLVGAALMWANPSGLAAGVSLPILGAGLSLLFPVMVLVTPRWLGPSRAAVATGYQFGAASVGVVVFSVLIGQFAEASGLEVLGPVLFAVTVAAAVLLLVMRTEAERSSSQPAGQA
ncbi:MAG: MFS transporter [Acidimicrobiia bacterium]|nr:MFS transporter [Acidimicrobiia bacterium]